MTLGTTAPLIDYVENGATLVHAIPFQFRALTEIVCSRISAGVETALVQGADFTVTGGAGGTGSVTKTNGGVNGQLFRIKRVTPRDQPTDYTPGDAFPAETHEAALDHEMAVSQEIEANVNETVGRTLRVAVGETVAELPGAVARKGTILGFNVGTGLRELLSYVGLANLLVGPLQALGVGAVAGPAGPMGPAGDLAKADTRAALAATPIVGLKPTRWLAEIGRVGLFMFSTANLSAAVASDPLQGMYVAPASDATGASGAWVRQNVTEYLIEWWGGVGDFNGAIGSGLGAGTDNVAAWDAMFTLISYENRNASFVYLAGPPVLFRSPAYYFSTARDLKTMCNVRGFGSGSSAAQATRFVFAASQAGIRAQRSDTVGEAGAGANTHGSDGAIIEGICFESLGGAPDFLKAGVWKRAAITVRNCSFYNFPGPGILVYATAGGVGAAYGNANGWVIDGRIRIQGCKYGGLWVQGADVNAGKAGAVLDIANCARYGIRAQAFLSSVIMSAQVDSCGIHNAAGLHQTAMVSDGTYLYRLVDGQDAAAAGTAPTVGGDNAVWVVQGLGAASAGAPLYATYVAGGGAFVSGGSYYGVGTNGSTPFIGCYIEGGQPDPWMAGGGDLVISGLMGQGRVGFSPHINGSTRGVTNQNGWAKIWVNPLDGTVISFGIGDADKTTILRASHSTAIAADFRIGLGIGGGSFLNDIWYSFGGLDMGRYLPSGTTETLGTGVAQYGTHVIHRFALGAFGSSRKMDYAGAAPAANAHAQGEIVFNIAPNASGAGSNAGWKCTVAGTPGTWAPFGGTAAHQADSVAGTVAALVTDFNALLAKLQAAGLMA